MDTADWAVMCPMKRARFGIYDARKMMLRDDSQLRNIRVFDESFKVGAVRTAFHVGLK